MYYKSARCYATIFFSHECASLVERFYVIRNSKGVCYYIKKVHKETTPVVVYPFMRLNIKIHNHSHNSHKPNELLHSDLIITFFHYLSTPYPICMPSKTLWLVIPYGILLLISIHPLILTISFTIQNRKTVALSLISF